MAVENEILTGKGVCTLPKLTNRVQITYRTTVPFSVFLDGALIGPNNALERVFTKIYEIDQVVEFKPLELSKSAPYSVELKIVPSNEEKGGGENLLQEEEPLTQYDMLAMKYEAKFRAFAESKGMDTFEDENESWDEEEDDDNQAPLTHYETKVMVDELPVRVLDEKQKELNKVVEETEKMIGQDLEAKDNQ
jgi:hypothetical protein